MENETASTWLIHCHPTTNRKQPCKLSLCMRCISMRLVKIGNRSFTCDMGIKTGQGRGQL